MVAPLAGEVSSPKDEFSEAAEDLKSAGKSALKGLNSVFDSAGKSVEKITKPLTSRACVGKWVFTNGKSTTTIECDEDGTMSFTQGSGLSSTTYAGSYTSTASVITFRITKKTGKTLFTKGSDSVDESWKISYKSSSDERLTVTCPSFLKDANGYDFSNPTVFVKK